VGGVGVLPLLRLRRYPGLDRGSGLHADQRNDIDTKAKLRDYALAKLNSPWSIDTFVEEMGCNAGTTRRFGRSPLGERAIQNTPANPGVSQSVCAAITAGHGVVYYETKTGAYTTVDFTAFIHDCRCHNAQEIEEVTAQHGVTFKLLSPYSPMVNPIEEVFGKIKGLLSGSMMGRSLAAVAMPEGSAPVPGWPCLLRLSRGRSRPLASRTSTYTLRHPHDVCSLP
jgi:hypothetical protein